MAIRTAPVTDPVFPRQKELQRIVFSDDGISTVWLIPGPDGIGIAPVVVEVSPKVAAALLARATWTSAVDAVANDTCDRAILP